MYSDNPGSRSGPEVGTDTETGGLSPLRRLFPTGIHVALVVYAALYVLFVAVGFMPSEQGSPVSDSVPYHPFGLEGVLVKLLFAFFMVGFLMVWRDRLAAGVLLLTWWAGMWGMEILMVSLGHTGGAIAMGFPMFVVGGLLVLSGLRRRRRRRVASEQPPARP